MVRFKNRFIVVEVNSNPKVQDAPLQINNITLTTAILQKVEELHGQFGIAAINEGFAVKYCNAWTRVALVRIRHGPHQIVASSLPFVTNLNKRTVMLNTLYVGATLCQCYKFLRIHQRRKLDKMWSKLHTEEERKEMEAAVMDLSSLEVLGNTVASVTCEKKEEE
ncbi:ribonuclease P/MRP protein subunit POP5 [Anabrus simplex]|uniref:ribonuclease P/MRP protein subunit POP5 n=1 Tax=Anabrus simplex TaxID=316456 RepID=UPI0035A3A8BE